MGTIISLAIAAIFSLLSLLSKPLITLLSLLFVVIFFSEFGEGFSSFTGSIFYNQSFTNLFRMKLIEIVLAACYAIILFKHKRNNCKNFLSFDKKIVYLFLILMFILTIVGVVNGHGINIIGWRYIVSGLIFAHLMYLILDTEDKALMFVKLLILFLFARALLGLAMYAAGYGVNGPRGNVPFFWDSRQVAAFAFGAIIITGYILQYKTLEPADRMFGKWLSYIILATFIVTVLLSIRRTSWAFIVLGIGASIISTKKINITHHIGLLATLIILLVSIMYVPQLKNIRDNLEKHVNSLNLFEQSVAKQQQNAVHMDNVDEYSKIIFNDKDILMFGFIGRKGENFNQFKATIGNDFNLGKAHNGILRSTLVFGLGGTLLYVLLYFHLIIKAKKILKIPINNSWHWISKGCLLFLGLQFASALTFVPPFHTTIKGNIYTFIALFFAYAGLYFHQQNTNKSTVIEDANTNTKNNKRILAYKNNKT